MSPSEAFQAAQKRVKTLRSTPSSSELLELYGLYKQGSGGDAQGERPSMLDFKGRAKYDAWKQQKGVTPEDAMGRYVEVVERLVAKYGASEP